MASKQKREKKPVEVVVFNDPAKRKKKDNEQPEQTKVQNQNPRKRENDRSQPTPVMFDQKRAKYDIRKLGILGMEKKEKESAMVDYLVELGAKKPKNRCYHIQEYQKMMKAKQEEEEKKVEMERKAGIKAKRSKPKRKRDKDDILNYVDGQAGFYKDGVQFVKGLKR